MAAVDDLTELVESAAAAERAALSAKWKDRADVEGLTRKVEKSINGQREELVRALESTRSPSGRWARLGQAYLDLGVPAGAIAGDPEIATEGPTGAGRHGLADSPTEPTEPTAKNEPSATNEPSAKKLTPAEAAAAERNAVAAVMVARMALSEAQYGVLQARLARIDAGEDDPDAAAVDGHVPLHGRNSVSRHGPALARGVRGEIEYMLTRRPRTIVRSLAVSLAMGLLYLGFIRVFKWERDGQWAPYLGLFVLSVVMGGSVCINAMSFDAMRVRAALDSGARLWHLLVIKNLALLTIVAPLGFVLSALLAWRVGDWGALWKACILTILFILLWMGVGNVLSVVLPIRDEPIKKRKQSGSLKQFLIAFAVSYGVGYLVNFMLVWRIFAARELAARLHEWVLPAIALFLGGVFMYLLLTIVAVALAQQPKVRRSLQREIADYTRNAEAEAYAAEAAAAERDARPDPADLVATSGAGGARH